MNMHDTDVYIPRFLEDRLLQSFDKKVVTMLAGARQVGKSTLLQRVQEHVREKVQNLGRGEGLVFERKVFVYTLDDIQLRAALKKDISYIEKDVQLVLGKSIYNVEDPIYVFIDEIQKYPLLLDWIKQVYDRNSKNVKFFITGSSVSGFKEKMVETLAGRLETIHLYPINLGELVSFRKGEKVGWFLRFLKEVEDEFGGGGGAEQILAQVSAQRPKTPQVVDFTTSLLQTHLRDIYTLARTWSREFIAILWEAMFFGGLPRIFQVSLEERIKTIRDYVSVYLEKEVGFIARNLDLELFGLSVSAFAEQSGQLLNIQKVSKEVGVARPSLYRYLDLLENTFLIRRLYPYSRGNMPKTTKSVVMHYVDPGLVNVLVHIDSITNLAKDPEAIKRAAGSMILNMLLTYFEFLENPPKLFYWADYQGHKVDFLFDWYNLTLAVILGADKQDARRLNTTLEKLASMIAGDVGVVFLPFVPMPTDSLEFEVTTRKYKKKTLILVRLPLAFLV